MFVALDKSVCWINERNPFSFILGVVPHSHSCKLPERGKGGEALGYRPWEHCSLSSRYLHLYLQEHFIYLFVHAKHIYIYSYSHAHTHTHAHTQVCNDDLNSYPKWSPKCNIILTQTDRHTYLKGDIHPWLKTMWEFTWDKNILIFKIGNLHLKILRSFMLSVF